MAFTLDQNVSGAAAAPQPVTQISNTSITAGVLGNLLDVGSSFARAQTAAPTATQSDRNSAAFKGIVDDIDKRIASKESLDSIAQDVAVDLASLGLNEQQRNIISQKFGGEDIFFVPKQAPSVVDMNISLFQESTLLTQRGLVNQELEKAQNAGETISNEVAVQRAIAKNAAFQSAANAGVLQGNIDWLTGFDQNIKTLESFSETLGAALRVETGGGNFDIRDLQKLRDGYLGMKSQPSFQKPVGPEALKKWELMKARMESIEATFIALQEYDSKNATEIATNLMAQIALKDGGSPFAALALKDPNVMATVAANATDELLEAIASNYKPETVDFKSLNPDPVILELMGFTPSGTALSSEAIVPVPPADVVFSSEVSSKFDDNDTWTNGKNMMYHKGVIDSLDVTALGTSEGVNAYASSITTLAYGLTKNKQPSTGYMDTLLSNDTINKINRLAAEGGENGRIAANLKAQIGVALQHNQTLYGSLAAGKVQAIPGIGIDTSTGKYTLTDTTNPDVQKIAAIVAKYYGKDFEAMWKEGASARSLLQSRLSRTGQIEVDSPSYDKFRASTEVLDGALWRGMSGQYSQVSGIPKRLQYFKDRAAKLKLDLGTSPAESVYTSSPARILNSEAYGLIEEGEEFRDTDGKLRTRQEEVKQGTDVNPWRKVDAKTYESIPAGAYYIAADDPTQTVRIKGGN